MYLFVKLWKPKQAWHELSKQERLKYVKQALDIMYSISSTIETIAWMDIVDMENKHDTPYHYCSVYKFYDKYDADVFHNKMIKFKWYDYFEQTNILGEIESPGAVLNRIIQL